MPITKNTTKAHCNSCGKYRNHEILHSELTSWADSDYDVSGNDSYETLKCCGCELIKLRHTSWNSEERESSVYYFPPEIFRRNPDWFSDLWRELNGEHEFVEDLLKEIYIALQNNLPSLATMGIRALLEQIMISKSGDHGTFAKNIAEFERLGHVSKLQRERLEAILEAGHAAIHRAYKPKIKDVITLLDITEHIVESVFLHEAQIEALKKRVPARVKPST
jgi:Domain of unknown function (DUF4145)